MAGLRKARLVKYLLLGALLIAMMVVSNIVFHPCRHTRRSHDGQLAELAILPRHPSLSTSRNNSATDSFGKHSLRTPRMFNMVDKATNRYMGVQTITKYTTNIQKLMGTGTLPKPRGLTRQGVMPSHNDGFAGSNIASTASLLSIRNVSEKKTFEVRNSGATQKYHLTKKVTRVEVQKVPKVTSVKQTSAGEDAHPQILESTEESMNSRELSRFHDLLSRWPPQKPKAAIYLLVQRNKIRFKWALRCIYTLDMFFNKKYKYPIIFFHEDLQKTQIERLRKLSSSDLYFQQVIFEIPPFINRSQVHNITICSGHPIGYRHMCRFHSKLVFEQPIMSRLEYYWRLDDDSRITRPIKYDLFQFMAKNEILYGYNNKTTDEENCVYKLWEYTEQYIEKENIKTSFFKNWIKGEIFFSNFELSALSLWTSTFYKEYINYIDHLGGIFYFRWGDAPIKSLAVSMFVPKQNIHHFKDIGYQHYFR